MQIVQEYLKSHWPPYVYTSLRVLVVLVGAWIIVAMIKSAILRMQKRLSDRPQTGTPAERAEDAKRHETLARLLEQAVVITMWAIATIVILGQLGVAVGPLLAGAGIAGIAVGFGAQNLVRDVISGFFLIFENQVRVGDIATVNGKTGLVERITLRTIVLRDLTGTVHIVPNGLATTVSNLTSGWSAYVVDIGVSYDADTDKVMQVMKEAGADIKADPVFGPLMIADLDMFGLDKFGDSALVIKARLRTVPGRQNDVGREFNRRLKKAFDLHGIEIPFPQRTLHLDDSAHSLLASSTPQAPPPV